jgi:hypothetical protein
MVDRMFELGNPDGRAVWHRIRRAIEALQGKPEWGDALGRSAALLNAPLRNVVKLPLVAG